MFVVCGATVCLFVGLLFVCCCGAAVFKGNSIPLVCVWIAASYRKGRAKEGRMGEGGRGEGGRERGREGEREGGREGWENGWEDRWENRWGRRKGGRMEEVRKVGRKRRREKVIEWALYCLVASTASFPGLIPRPHSQTSEAIAVRI